MTMKFIINLQGTSCVEKISRLKLYLPRQKWTITETLISFKIQAVLKKYLFFALVEAQA